MPFILIGLKVFAAYCKVATLGEDLIVVHFEPSHYRTIATVAVALRDYTFVIEISIVVAFILTVVRKMATVSDICLNIVMVDQVVPSKIALQSMQPIGHEIVVHLKIRAAIIRIDGTKRVIVGKYEIVVNASSCRNDRRLSSSNVGYVRYSRPAVPRTMI